METNLNSSFSDTELGLGDYYIYRRDRYLEDSSMKGGGILVMIKKIFTSSVIFCDYNIECEQLFVKFVVAGKAIIHGAVYIPPSSQIDFYKIHVDTVENLYSELDDICDFILIGDYNLTGVNWVNSADIESLNINFYNDDYSMKHCANLIVNSFSFLDFNQRYRIHKENGFTLDLCFTTLCFLRDIGQRAICLRLSINAQEKYYEEI